MQIITNNAGKELKKHGDNAFPFLVSYERLSGYETGSFLWHWHPEIELTYVKKGEMLYKVNQNTFHLKEGQALFGNANALHAGYMYQNQDCQYIPVTFDPKLIYGFSGSALFQKYTEPILRSFSLSAVPLDFSCDWHQDAVEDIRQMIRLDSQHPGKFCAPIRLLRQLPLLYRMKKITAEFAGLCPILQIIIPKKSSWMTLRT